VATALDARRALARSQWRARAGLSPASPSTDPSFIGAREPIRSHDDAMPSAGDARLGASSRREGGIEHLPPPRC